MKTKIISMLMVSMTILACNQKKQEESQSEPQTTISEGNTDTIATDTQSDNNAQFACSMHPEVIGNKGEKCSKCGMDLTEPVSN